MQLRHQRRFGYLPRNHYYRVVSMTLRGALASLSSARKADAQCNEWMRLMYREQTLWRAQMTLFSLERWLQNEDEPGIEQGPQIDVSTVTAISLLLGPILSKDSDPALRPPTTSREEYLSADTFFPMKYDDGQIISALPQQIFDAAGTHYLRRQYHEAINRSRYRLPLHSDQDYHMPPRTR